MPVEFIKPGTHIDFIGKRRIAAMLSVGLLVASMAAAAVNGVRLGIDFAGGTEIQVRFADGVVVEEGAIRSIVNGIEGIQEASVVRYGEVEDNQFLIKFRAAVGERDSAEFDLPTAGGAESPGEAAGEDADEAAFEALGESPDEAAADAEVVDAGEENADEGAAVVPTPDGEVETEAAAESESIAAEAESADVEVAVASDKVVQLDHAFGKAFGGHSIERVEFVGPRVGAELRNDGLAALAFAAIAILIYVWFRFSSRFAPGAIVAVVHDLSITAGVFVIIGLEFDLRILAAMLAILGYSLNDTIIIYDRIRENMELRTKADLPEVLNLSINQTLSRTVLTSGTTLLALFSLLFLGGEVIWPFAFAMILGVIVGTYSSIYIASPTLLVLEEWLGK